MKIKIDKQNGTLYFRLGENSIVESEEIQPDVIMDFDKEGVVVGVEVLDLAARLSREDLDNLQVEFV
ncbi:MAG TPA: DUF2283 domain-containing protein [Anaerolineales bacterium]|nr:DUF2283 domain-containing protein [Anaerolineales bacterium]